jgi:WD40 repeat protein
MVLPSGTRLGQYEIRSLLGRGSLGEVYLAEDSRLKRPVALKLLAPSALGEEDGLRLFEQEARAASALNHPNLLTIYEIGRADSETFIAAEFVDGVTLRQHLAEARMGLAEALGVATQIASALTEAHAIGIAHLDLKPENVMLRRDGYVKVLDFGTAKLTMQQPSPADVGEADRLASGGCERGPIAGTFGYMSPEQIRGDEVDTRADIWSLGVVLFEMITGRQPFCGAGVTEVADAILQREPPTLGSARDDVPLELESIVRRALEKDRDARYQTAQALAADLRKLKERHEAATSPRVLSGAPSSASTARLGTERAEGQPLPARDDFAWRYRKWLLWAGAAATLAALCDVLILRPAGGGREIDVGLLLLAVLLLLCHAALRRSHAPASSAFSPVGVAFRGLLPFQEADRDRFYGRETETLVLFEMVAHNLFRFGVLFGESGCGKTSLVKAALVPKLREEGYVPVYCRSYKDPLAALVEECRKQSQLELRAGETEVAYLRRVAEELSATLVVIFDQFEEFFVNFRTRPERAPFVALVKACHEDARLPLKFLFSLRSDFLYLINTEFAGQVPEPLLSSKIFHLHNFDEAKAVGIIERCARRADLPLEAGLTRQVARDLSSGGTVLPSELQIVGERLQAKRLYTLQDYRRAGGKERLVHSFLQDVIEMSGDRSGAQLLLRSLISDENTRLTLTVEEISRRTQRGRDSVERLLRIFVASRLVRELQEEAPWRYELVHEYLIEKINQVTGRVLDATQRANRLLRQYLSSYASDRATRIPLGKLWFIRRYADEGQRGERARELLKRSLRWGLLRACAVSLLLAALTTGAAAMLSVSEEWEGVRLSDGHTAAARQAAFSPDGRLLVSVGEDGRIVVWDFARRERLATFTDHTERVNCVAFSPDGKWFATGGDDQTVIVWDAARLSQAAVLREHQSYIVAVGFSPDGRHLVTMASDPPRPPWTAGGRAVVWSVGSWEKAGELWKTSFSYANLQFHPDGRQIVFADGAMWDVATQQQTAQSLDPNWAASWFSLSPDARHFVGIDGFGDVVFWDIKQRRAASRLHGHQDHGRAALFSPDGRLLASGAEDIILWDAATHEKLVRLEHTAIVWSLSFSPDGRWLVSTHGDGSILLWDVAERARVANLNEHSAPVRAVAFSPDGRLLASAGEDRSVIIWDAERRRKEAVLIGHDSRVTSVAFSPDGTRVVSGDQGGIIMLWDWAQRRPLKTFRHSYKGYSQAIYCVAISPDGRWVAATSGVYDAEAEDDSKVVDLFNTSPLTEGAVYGVAFSADGRRLVCVTDSGRVVLLETETWHLLGKLQGEKMTLVTVSFSPDGRWIATGEDQGAVRLWESEPLRPAGVIGQHAARVKSVAFSPDGRQIVSAGDDHLVALWDIRSRSLVTRIGTHAAPVLAVAFSPDARRLASGEHDRTVRLYTRRRTLWGYRLD